MMEQEAVEISLIMSNAKNERKIENPLEGVPSMHVLCKVTKKCRPQKRNLNVNGVSVLPLQKQKHSWS